MNIGIHEPIKRTIQVAGRWNSTIEEREVEATVYGDFAVHRPIGPPYADEYWTLTHIRTGRCLPHGLRYKFQLEGLIAVLADLDWDFDTPADLPPRTKEWAEERIRAFEGCNKEQQRCWSYEVPTRAEGS